MTNNQDTNDLRQWNSDIMNKIHDLIITFLFDSPDAVPVQNIEEE